MIYYLVDKKEYRDSMSTNGAISEYGKYNILRFKNDSLAPEELDDVFLRMTASEVNALKQFIDNNDNIVNKKNKDASDRPFFRHAITQSGWSFLAHFIEGATSTLDSIYCEDHAGNKEAQHYCKFYGADGIELTEQSDIDTSCVKSVFTIVPAIDYEIVSGEIHQFNRPETDIRMHSLIGAFMPNGTPISVKPFVKNLNMKFKDKAKAIITDGRAPKLLRKDYAGLPFDANQIQIVVNHDVGIKHQFMVELEYYRQ